MRSPWTAAALVCAGSLLAACGRREEIRPSPPEKAAPPAVAEATPSPQPTSDAEPAAAPKSSAPAPRSPRPETASVPQKPVQAGAGGQVSPPPPAAAAPPPTAAPSAPSVDSPKPAPSPSAEGVKGVVDPGGAIAVPPAKEGLERVGAEKCRLCHKVQHESWAASKHAQRTPPLDCESCHGAGSEYRTLAVMKDPAKARAAGLVLPGASFCGKCHKGAWNPALIGKVHAHKVAP